MYTNTTYMYILILHICILILHICILILHICIYYIYINTGERHDVSQAKTAVHDMWLLSMSDRAVISAFSTFGYIGISLYTYIIYN